MMNTLKKCLLIVGSAVSVGMAGTGTATASAFASSILDINNFRLLHSNGSDINASDFRILTGTNNAHATAELNNVFANGAQTLPILSGANPDVLQQCLGAPCPALTENNFTPFPSPPPVPGTFGYADQNLNGASIAVGPAPAGARAQTRAEASLNVNGVAAGNSDVGTSTTFAFLLAAADTITINFDATPYTQAFVSADSGPTTDANARLSWSINIFDITSGISVFSFAPNEINALSNVSRTDGAAGITTYNPGLINFITTTGLLSAADSYQLTIQHNTLANALQSSIQAVPEPATLAIFGIGLLGMSLLGRRRKI